MFIQFFGGYLLSKGVVTSEQLISATERESSAHIKLGTLAIHAGLMTAEQVEEVQLKQTHEDLRFGELCVKYGYLKDEDINELLSKQYPKYLILGQILEEDGVISYAEFSTLLKEYTATNEISEEMLPGESEEVVNTLLANYLEQLDNIEAKYLPEFLKLMLNNLVRFVGSDYTVLPPMHISELAAKRYSSQAVTGEFGVKSYIEMDETCAIRFASRYASMEFTEFDEYVSASLEDFLNLNNGLFNVNVSNSYNVELGLEPPVSGVDEKISLGKNAYCFSVLFPFGIVNLIIEL